MTLEDFFKRNAICGFNLTELKNIMALNSGYTVMNAPPKGAILHPQDGRIKSLGCVIDHFTNDENGKKLKLSKSNSSMNGCYYIQKALGCTQQASPGECRNCFFACLNKLENGQVYRINK